MSATHRVTARRITDFQRMRILVMGLGRFGGGVGVARWLVSQGARVTITDTAPEDSLAASIAELADLNLAMHLGEHDPADLDAVDLVVVNPAVVKHRSPFFGEIIRRKVAWTTEMNLFCERCPAAVIGVTGSFGKSTTCVMLADALQACMDAGLSRYTGVHLGGNIGRSLLPDLPAIRPSDLVVLEMSNAQLEDLPRIAWAPAVAVITNLVPHHLDRHPVIEDYIAAKLNITADPRGISKVIVGTLDPRADARLAATLRDNPARLVRTDPSTVAPALRVPGQHNRDNAACVLTIARMLELEETTVCRALERFPGLPHRLQYVRSLDGADYYNDSKSTAPSAAVQAMASFDRPIVAIVGGQRKDASLNEWAEVAARRCKAVICVGEGGAGFAEALTLGSPNADGVVHRTVNLQEAILHARRLAQPGDIVLFSPGAPSFDHYLNFSDRGLHFTNLVNQELGDRPT